MSNNWNNWLVIVTISNSTSLTVDFKQLELAVYFCSVNHTFSFVKCGLAFVCFVIPFYTASSISYPLLPWFGVSVFLFPVVVCVSLICVCVCVLTVCILYVCHWQAVHPSVLPLRPLCVALLRGRGVGVTGRSRPALPGLSVVLSVSPSPLHFRPHPPLTHPPPPRSTDPRKRAHVSHTARTCPISSPWTRRTTRMQAT